MDICTLQTNCKIKMLKTMLYWQCPEYELILTNGQFI